MTRHLRLRLPSPALVMAMLALLVALSGTSYAALALPKNSVGAAQIRTGAVTSLKVRDGGLQVLDLAPAARDAPKGQVGPQGPAGPKGDKGEAGPGGISGWEMVTATASSDSNSRKSMTVACPSGKRLLGGSAGAFARLDRSATELHSPQATRSATARGSARPVRSPRRTRAGSCK
jgi:hypothetical protein